MPRVSVIMSAYNTEQYVGKAIESILVQTFRDFEFLIVDNGSTDGSRNIIGGYAKKDKRIRTFYNNQNVEPSQALNFCLNMAMGEFVYVIDSDDWVLPEMLEKMIMRADRHNAQLVYTGFYMDHLINERSYIFKVCPSDADYTQEEFRKKAIEDLTRMILSVYWNKLYRKEFLLAHNIQFRATKMFDHHFNMDVLMGVERVSTIGEPLYHYIRARQGSYMRNNPYLNQKKRELFEHTMELYRHWGICDPETMGKLAEHHLGDVVRCVTETVTSQNTNEYKRQELERIIDDKWTKFAIDNCPKGTKARLFRLLFQSRSIWLCKMAGWGIHALEEWVPGVYYRLRTKVAQKGATIEQKT